MPHPALLLLLHGSGPLDALMLGGPVIGLLALIGGVIVAPFFRGAAKLSFPSAYGIAVGGLIAAGLLMGLTVSLMDGGLLDDRWGEWRMWLALAGAATTLITLGSVVPTAGRVLRVLGLVLGVGSTLLIGYIFLVGS
jgi:hypothetical protein